MTAHNSSLRIGIIGAGNNTRQVHIPQLQALSEVVITSVANRSLESGNRVAGEFKIPNVYENWQDLVSSKEVDAVLIGTWPYLHCEATCSALRAGKHVLTEARMAMNAAEAQQMLSLSRELPDRVTQVVPAPFTLHADRTIQKVLSENRLGRLLHFRFQFDMPPSTPNDAPLHWRRNVQYSGMNIMFLGIAYESLMRWLGPTLQVTANARTFNSRAIDLESGEPVIVEIPDYLAVQMEMENGMSGSLVLTETGATSDIPGFMIFGDLGVLHIPFQTNGELRIQSGFGPDSTWEPVPIAEEDRGGWRVEEEFVNAIRGKETVQLTTFETGVEYMIFTEAVYRSWKMEGLPVSLADI